MAAVHDVPGVTALHKGIYCHGPHWHFNFLYQSEQARALDCEEDLAAPGSISWQLDAAEADLILAASEYVADGQAQSGAAACVAQIRRREQDRERPAAYYACQPMEPRRLPIEHLFARTNAVPPSTDTMVQSMRLPRFAEITNIGGM